MRQIWLELLINQFLIKKFVVITLIITVCEGTTKEGAFLVKVTGKRPTMSLKMSFLNE